MSEQAASAAEQPQDEKLKAEERMAAEAAAQQEQQRADGIKSNFFRTILSGADPASETFAAGISNIAHFVQNEATPHITELTSLAGSKFCHMIDTVNPGQPNQYKREFIGLTVGMAKAQPLTDKIADDIALMAKTNNWREIEVHGTPQERDMLWLAAMKQGIKVVNHNPDADTRAKYDAFKAGEGQESSSPVADGASLPAAPASGISTSSFAAAKSDDNVIDAEWEEVKPVSGFLPAPQQKNEGPKDAPDAGGPKRLPPPPKGP